MLATTISRTLRCFSEAVTKVSLPELKYGYAAL